MQSSSLTQISNRKNQNYNSKLKNIFPVKKYRISGTSMSPLLQPGNFVLVINYFPVFFKPRKGDVIACVSPVDGKILIKRITKIENNSFFVEGDNKTASTDSRKFGMIDKDSIIGKVIFVL